MLTRNTDAMENKIPISYDCSVCHDTYDVTRKKPYILTSCSHILCVSCMKCVQKLGENVCPICKSEFEKVSSSLASIKETSDDCSAVHSELSNLQRLREELATFYSDESTQKNLYFERLRLQVKKKTQDALSKLCQDEINILSEVDKLEKKFDNILMNFNEFDRDLQKDIKSWQPEINKLDDKNSDVLTNKIRNEANTLKNFLSKLRRAAFRESFFSLNDVSIDEPFLNLLIEKNSQFRQMDQITPKENEKEKSPLVDTNAGISLKSNSESTLNKSSNESSSSDEDFDSICHKCKKELTGTYNIYNDKRYHAECFACCQCQHVILESIFYNKNEKPLCRICFNMNLVEVASKCHKCGQVILDTLVSYKGNEFHDYCLTCKDCDKSLIGHSIYSDAEKRPYCIECFTIKEAKFCESCKKSIFPNQTSFLFNARHYHRECFVCSRCQRQINSEETFFKNKEDNSLFVCTTCFKK